jgi:hypothetical protein
MRFAILARAGVFGHDECGKHQVHLPLSDIVLRYGLTGSPTM